MAVGIDLETASRAAERVVTNRTETIRRCEGPSSILLDTLKLNSGDWATFFIPVLHLDYSKRPSC